MASRPPLVLLFLGGAIAFCGYAGYQAITRLQQEETDAQTAGFHSSTEQRMAETAGFTSPASFCRYLDTERVTDQVEEQKRVAAVAKEKAETEARKLREEMLWQEAARIAIALKKSMKNPDSFKLESAMRTHEGFYCFEYRATNSFNAIVPGKAVVGDGKAATSDDRSTFTPLWNKRCTQRGENLPNLIYAMKNGYF